MRTSALDSPFFLTNSVNLDTFSLMLSKLICVFFLRRESASSLYPYGLEEYTFFCSLKFSICSFICPSFSLTCSNFLAVTVILLFGFSCTHLSVFTLSLPKIVFLRTDRWLVQCLSLLCECSLKIFCRNYLLCVLSKIMHFRRSIEASNFSSGFVQKYL